MSDLTATSFRLSLRREEVRGGTGRGWAPIMATRAPTAMATHAAGGSPGGSWDQGPGLTGGGGRVNRRQGRWNTGANRLWWTS